MEKEREIYIKDMLFYILRKWRVILIGMLIFAVVADGIAAVKSYREMIALQQEQNSVENKLETSKAELSEEDIKKVDETYDLYLTYKKAFDSSMDYYEHSIKMQIDPNNVATITLQYSIDNSKMLKDIVEAYSNMVMSDETCKVISEKLNVKPDSNYIDELINFYINDNDGNDKVAIVEDVDNKLMIVNIIAPDKESGNIITDVIEEEIQEQTSKIQKALGDFKIEKADRIYVNKASDTLLNEQQNFMSSLNDIKTSISNLTTTLTEEQKNYYTVLLNSSEDSVEEKDVDIVVFKPINLKYIVLGLFIGGFLIIVCYGILYTVKGNLKVEKEIEEYYGIPFLGKVQSEKNALNGIDYFFDKIFNQAEKYSEEECLQLICTNILINIRKKHMKHIHITGIADSEYTDKIKRQVVEELQSEHLILECSVGKSIIHNINSLNDLANSDGVVFVEEIGKSNFEEIGKEINFCLNNNINVIGAIVID